MSLQRRGLIAGLLLLAQVVTGCTSWRVQSVSPQELIARDHPKAIQVHESGGAVYVIHSPRVASDSLIGMVGKTVRDVEFRGIRSVRLEQQIAVSMTMVDRVAVRKLSPMKVVWWVVGFPLAAFMVAVGFSGNACCR